MSLFAVTYTHKDDDELHLGTRGAHREFLTRLAGEGTVLAAGAWSDRGQPGGLLILEASRHEDVEAALDDDPYRRVGLIVGREIREWGAWLRQWKS